VLLTELEAVSRHYEKARDDAVLFAKAAADAEDHATKMGQEV
jgi:hypothetical protein